MRFLSCFISIFQKLEIAINNESMKGGKKGLLINFFFLPSSFRMLMLSDIFFYFNGCSLVIIKCFIRIREKEKELYLM